MNLLTCADIDNRDAVKASSIASTAPRPFVEMPGAAFALLVGGLVSARARSKDLSQSHSRAASLLCHYGNLGRRFLAALLGTA